MELSEAEAALRQLIEVGCVDLSTVTADIRIAHVIGQHDDDVRTFLRRNYRPGQGKRREDGENEQSCFHVDIIKCALANVSKNISKGVEKVLVQVGPV